MRILVASAHLQIYGLPAKWAETPGYDEPSHGLQGHGLRTDPGDDAEIPRPVFKRRAIPSSILLLHHHSPNIYLIMASRVILENTKAYDYIKKNKVGMTTAKLFSTSSKAQVELVFAGSFTTNGVNEATFDSKTNWSFGFKFGEKEDIKNLKYLLEPFNHPSLEGWERNPLTKNGSIYFKLKKDEFGDFPVVHNFDGELEDVPKDTPVTVHAKVHAYFDVEKKTYGIYYTVTQLEF